MCLSIILSGVIDGVDLPEQMLDPIIENGANYDSLDLSIFSGTIKVEIMFYFGDSLQNYSFFF